MNNALVRSNCTCAATRLKDVVDEAPEPQLMLLCAQSLHEMGENLHLYTSGLHVSAPFFEELCETVLSVCQDSDIPVIAMHDKAFGLMECLAIIARESTLRQKLETALPVQADVMRYFEGCEHWTPGDGTLVSEIYYSRIPKAAAGH
jgi:hypothetical protein